MATNMPTSESTPAPEGQRAADVAPWDGKRERRKRRNPAEDAHYVAGRTAEKTAAQRRGAHQMAVETQAPGRPYYLTRTQAVAVLLGLGVGAITLSGLLGRPAVEGEAGFEMGEAVPLTHVELAALQEQGGVVLKLVRHFTKWLPTRGPDEAESVTTIALSDEELAEVTAHLPAEQPALRPVGAEGGGKA